MMQSSWMINWLKLIWKKGSSTRHSASRSLRSWVLNEAAMKRIDVNGPDTSYMKGGVDLKYTDNSYFQCFLIFE